MDCSNTGITSIDVSNNTALTALGCNNTGITSIDVSRNTELTSLRCNNTGITELDVSKNIMLVGLECENTKITSIDISNNIMLEILTCNNIGITSIDVSNNPLLWWLECQNSALTSLDLSNNPKIRWIKLSDTNLAYLNLGNINASPLIMNNNSTIDLGGVEGTFNIKEIFPGIDTDKITNISGASLDKATGIISGYVTGTPITYTYDCGTNKNQPVTLNVTLNFIIKGQSSIIINDDLNKVYDGQPVVEPINILTAGSTGAITFEWYTADGALLTSAPVNAGNYKVKAILAEDANFVSAETEKEFEITKAISTITINDELNKVYDGNLVSNPQVSVTGSTGAVSFEWYTVDGTPLTSAPVNAGNYKVKAILAGDSNHDNAETEKEFTITKASSTIVINDDLNKTYDGVAVVEPRNIVTTGSAGTISFEWYKADGTPLTSAPVDAGNYKVKAILAGDTNYAGAEVEKAFTITQATSNIVITVELNKVYDGNPVSDPQVSVTGSTGTITYEWYKKEESTTRAVIWTLLTEAPREVGSYKVVVTVAGDGNFEGVTLEREFSITEKVEEELEVVPTLEQNVTGVQTGDGTQVGLWTILVGLSTGMMIFFRRKNCNEEIE